MALSSQTQKTRAPRVSPFWNERRLTALLFLLPGLVIFLVFVVVPIFLSARYSLFDWNGLGGLTDFVGLGNYQKLMSDPFLLAKRVEQRICRGVVARYADSAGDWSGRAANWQAQGLGFF